MAPGWLPTIMAGPAQPCPQRDETHHRSPQTWLVASRRTDRALYPEASLDLVSGDGAVLGDLSASDVGGFDVRQVLRRLGEPLQVVRVNHRGHAIAPEGQDDSLMSGADTVDDLIEPATRNRDRKVAHSSSMGEGRSFHTLSPRRDSVQLLFLSLTAVASDLRNHSRNNDDPLRDRRISSEFPLFLGHHCATFSFFRDRLGASIFSSHTRLLEHKIDGSINDRRTTLLLTDPTMTKIAYILEIQVSVEKAR